MTAPFFRELDQDCYRMPGSVADVDDLLRETMLAAWQGLAGLAGRLSLGSWLYRIATNRYLDASGHSGRRPAGMVVLAVGGARIATLIDFLNLRRDDGAQATTRGDERERLGVPVTRS